MKPRVFHLEDRAHELAHALREHVDGGFYSETVATWAEELAMNIRERVALAEQRKEAPEA